MKEHITPDRYESWSTCFPLFKPLTVTGREEVEKGAAAFEGRYPGFRLFPDPFLKVERPRRTVPLATLRLVAANDPASQSAAARLISEIEARWGVALSSVPDGEPRSLLQGGAPLLILGGSERNRVAMEIARSYQIGPFDAVCPGPGGWGVTTHWELEAGMAPRYLLAFDGETAAAAIDAFLKAAIDEASGTPHLRWLHRVAPGPALKAAAGDFKTWLTEELERFDARFGSSYPTFQAWLASGMERPYREVVKEVFLNDLVDVYWKDGSLFYNAEFFDVGVRALHYYQWTGDEAALGFFREMMWGLWDYLHGRDPQIYLSDIDFRLGLFCNDWNWVEHDPLLPPEERRAFTLLLLGLLRMVHGYYIKNWKDRRPYKAFNHITFKARSLLLGWRYFRRWEEIPELAAWEAEAREVFDAIAPEAYKHQEDAGLYEAFVPDHLRTAFDVAGTPPPPAFQQALAWFALREWALVDPLFWSVEYGDSDPRFERRRPFPVAAWLSGETPEQEAIRRIERSCAGIFPPGLSRAAFWSFSGWAHEAADQPFPTDFLKGWTRIPLDPAFAERYGASGSESERFDKLVWRSGWEEEAGYIALNGLGAGEGKPRVGHAHHEANSILRMNLGGRIWLVNNGYGKSDQALPAAVLFATRKIGPEDHNTLIVRETACGGAILPPVNARRIDAGELPVPYAVTEMNGYGGVDWRRVIVVVPEAGFFVIDRASATVGGVVPPLELQWNLLGERSGDENRSRLEQHGVALEFDHLGSATAEWKESGITSWRGAVRSKAYPHTKAMPHQCIQRPSQPGAPTVWFANGLWLAGSVRSARWDEPTQTLRVETAKPLPQTASVDRPWGRVECGEQGLSVTLE